MTCVVSLVSKNNSFCVQIEQLILQISNNEIITKIYKEDSDLENAEIVVSDGTFFETRREVPIFVIAKAIPDFLRNRVATYFFEIGKFSASDFIESFSNVLNMVKQIKQERIDSDVIKRDRTAAYEIASEYEKNLSQAGEMQIKIMKNCRLSDFDVNIHYQPFHEVSGDMFFTKQIENKIFLFIGDVTDHGYFAGLYGASLYSIAASYLELASRYETDVVLWSRFVQNMSSIYKADVPFKALCSATMLFCEIDMNKNVAKFVSYGHGNEAPILISPGRAPKFVDCNEILVPIGEFSRKQASEATTVPFRQGDALLFYTDGITEIFADSEEHDAKTRYSAQRLLSSVEHESSKEAWTTESLLTGIRKDAESYSISVGLNENYSNEKINNVQDDVTIACLKWKRKDV